MAKEGRTISLITQIIFKDGKRYGEVLDYCWESGCLSWLSAKRMISNRLKNLEEKKLPRIERKALIKEIREYTDYLYYKGKNLQSKVRKARTALARDYD